MNSLFVTVNFCLIDEKINLVAEEMWNEKEKGSFGLFGSGLYWECVGFVVRSLLIVKNGKEVNEEQFAKFHCLGPEKKEKKKEKNQIFINIWFQNSLCFLSFIDFLTVKWKHMIWNVMPFYSFSSLFDLWLWQVYSLQWVVAAALIHKGEECDPVYLSSCGKILLRRISNHTRQCVWI